VGQAASTVRVTHAGLPTGEEVPLGAAVQLLKFDVDHYADQPRVSLYLPNKKNAGFDLKTTFENELGVKHRLPDGRAFRIKGYYPDLVMSERLQESGGASPALKLTLDGKPIFLMPNERERADSADGKVAVLFGWQRPAAKIDAPLHTVAIAKGEPVPVRLGETVTLAGIKVKALRFFPHFTFDLAKKQAMNVSDTPINPALEVEVDGGKPRWVFANMPGFGHGKEGPELTYAFSPEGGSAAATVVAVGGADKSVLVHHADGTEQTLALTDGLQVEGVQLGALLEKASVVREPSTASQQPNKPAVMVELFEGERAREVLMTAGQQDPVPVGKGYLTFETHVEDVKAFRSEVLVRGAGDPQRAIVAVNDPVPVGAWKLYQVNYDPKDPQYSGLEAVRDPGVNWVFLGFGLLFFGVFYMIYLAPRMRRREA
jgi:hypothetical protein